MDFASWSAIVGLLLLVMALSDSVLARLPLSTSMLYLAVGVAVSPLWLDWVASDADGRIAHARAHGRDRRAAVAVRLGAEDEPRPSATAAGCCRCASPSCRCSYRGLIAAAGVAWLGLSLGAAILLGGILAPTDPVLASDVQVAQADRPRPPALLAHRRGRPQRRHGVPVRVARPRPARPARSRRIRSGAGSRSTWSGPSPRHRHRRCARHARRPPRPLPASHAQGSGRASTTSSRSA